VSWQTVVEESSSYTVPAVPAAALNYIPRAEPVSSEAKLFLLDLPLLQDLDDVQRVATGCYWAGGAYFDPPWKGAVLFSSGDGAVYASVDETVAAVSGGEPRGRSAAGGHQRGRVESDATRKRTLDTASLACLAALDGTRTAL
jgi:hypothetical protein